MNSPHTKHKSSKDSPLVGSKKQSSKPSQNVTDGRISSGGAKTANGREALELRLISELRDDGKSEEPDSGLQAKESMKSQVGVL